MTLLAFILFTLAVYRVTRFLTQDHLIDSARNKFFDKFPPNKSKLGYLFTCGWCLSIWVAAILIIPFIFFPVFMFFVYAALAASAITGLLHDRF